MANNKNNTPEKANGMQSPQNNNNKKQQNNTPKQEQQNSHKQNNNKRGNNRNNISVKDEFELREKRLKLVYRVLYVAAALWAVIMLSLTKANITIEVVPFYAFLLSATSIFIIRIIKYALLEFRCMKIYAKSNDAPKDEAEISYDYIWSLFGLSLAIAAALLITHIKWASAFSTSVSLVVFIVCGSITLMFNIIDLVAVIRNKERSTKTKLVLDIVSAITSSVAAYYVCSIFLMLVTKNA